jgi:hypothetical protein
MIMLYDSESFTVLQVELADGAPPADDAAPGGFEILDKHARTGIYLGGELARHFRDQAEALAGDEADADTLDAFIAGFAGMGAQPLHLH